MQCVGDYVGSRARLNACWKVRRTEQARVYLNGIADVALREKAKAACRKDFVDLGVV